MKPHQGFYTNFDGALHGNLAEASAGVVLKDRGKLVKDSSNFLVASNERSNNGEIHRLKEVNCQRRLSHSDTTIGKNGVP